MAITFLNEEITDRSVSVVRKRKSGRKGNRMGHYCMCQSNPSQHPSNPSIQ